MTQLTVGAKAPSGPLDRMRAAARHLRGDDLFRFGVAAAAAVVLVTLAAMLVFLVVESLPAMRHYGFFSFLHVRWAPSEATATGTKPNPYGILQFIYGTLLTSVIAMLVTVPVAVAIALFITEFAPPRVRRPLSSLVDLLAAVPSVV